MVGREITPTEIGKHAKLIKAAQEDMAVMDVLVCGRCLTVFHFIEDFKQHKQKPCSKENNNVRECNDTKPKIWAFLLWKATQLNNNKESNTASPNSWALYQTWVKMDESLRETWIVAGKTIQSFAKVSQGGLQEMPVKITKTVVNNSADGVSPGRKPLAQSKPQITNLKPAGKLLVAGKDSENELTPNKAVGNATLQKIVKKPVTTAQLQSKANSTALASNKSLTRRAKRTVPNSDEIVEENVEKIVAKRFNPRRRMHEYLVKWESRSLEQNTWEPSSHLENVPHLLETFEKQLARQKETRAALQAKQQAANQAAAKATDVKATDGLKKEGLSPGNTKTNMKLPTLNTSDVSAPDGSKSQLASPADGSTRPQRTSKTKAMDQVKQWVAAGSNASNSAANSPSSEDSEATTGVSHNDGDWSMNASTNSVNASGLAGVKRKLEDSDYNDSNAGELPQSTTATIEDLEEDLIPSHTVKRMKNGNAVSVEVKTKNDKNQESKLVKVNGTTSRGGSVSGSESVSTATNSAEVIITQDSNASGVVKKPGFNGSSTNSQKTEAQIRVLSKGESAVSSSGIVRVTGVGSSNNTTTTTPANESSNAISEAKPQLVTRTQQVRVAAGGRQTPTQGRQILHQTQQIARTPSGTTIQRKTVPAGATPQQRSTTLQTRSITQTSPSSGRMIIPRQGVSSTGASSNAVGRGSITQKAVTPEQKILQLSKSGDLKVTKKVMTREDAVAQRLVAQQRQQQQQQQRQQQQSQVHIQKVQQLSGPGQRGVSSSVTVRKQQVPQPVQQEEEHQAQLCPITGKILGQDDSVTQQQLQGGVLQTQLVTEQQQLTLQQQQEQQQQQQQQQLHDIDPTLLLTQDHQMLTNEDGTPLLVTGEDGTVYQVAGKNAEGQTILVTQGPDGEQQFAYVAAAEGEADNQVLTLDNAVAEAVAQLPAEQQVEALAAAASEAGTGGGQYLVKTTQEDGTTQVVTMTEAELAQHQALAAQQQQQQQQVAANATSGATSQLCIQTGDGSDGQEANIPAEVVQAELPSPGGTRRVVLLLQDGTFMMTEMHDDEFKALNIAA